MIKFKMITICNYVNRLLTVDVSRISFSSVSDGDSALEVLREAIACCQRNMIFKNVFNLKNLNKNTSFVLQIAFYVPVSVIFER